MKYVFTIAQGVTEYMHTYQTLIEIIALVLSVVLFLRGVSLARWLAYRALHVAFILLLLTIATLFVWLIVHLLPNDTFSLFLNAACSFATVLFTVLFIRYLPGLLLTLKALFVLLCCALLALPLALSIVLIMTPHHVHSYTLLLSVLTVLTIILLGIFYQSGTWGAGFIVGIIATMGSLFMAGRLSLLDLGTQPSFINYFHLDALWPDRIISQLLNHRLDLTPSAIFAGLHEIHLFVLCGAVLSAVIQHAQERGSMDAFVEKHFFCTYPKNGFCRFFFELLQIFTYVPATSEKTSPHKTRSSAPHQDTEKTESHHTFQSSNPS